VGVTCRVLPQEGGRDARRSRLSGRRRTARVVASAGRFERPLVDPSGLGCGRVEPDGEVAQDRRGAAAGAAVRATTQPCDLGGALGLGGPGAGVGAFGGDDEGHRGDHLLDGSGPAYPEPFRSMTI
jgi:hypothetical protein